MQSMTDFLERFDVTVRVAEAVRRNPNAPDFKGDHWLVKIECSCGREMPVYFSQGKGHHGKAPTATAVLSCLAMDAVTVENAPVFDDWCAELGYDTDSRKAEATFNTCLSQAMQLRQLLGGEAYDALLYETEGD